MSQFAGGGSTGMQQQAMLGLGSPSVTTMTAANTYPASYPYQTFPTSIYPAATEALPTEVEVPVISKNDRAGIFLRDENGNLVHVETSKLFKAFLEW